MIDYSRRLEVARTTTCNAYPGHLASTVVSAAVTLSFGSEPRSGAPPITGSHEGIAEERAASLDDEADHIGFAPEPRSAEWVEALTRALELLR